MGDTPEEPVLLERREKACMGGKEVNAVHKAAAASVGSILTSLFTTPFDVVKTRMQSRLHAASESRTGSLRDTISCPQPRPCTHPMWFRCWRNGCTRQLLREYASVQATTFGTLLHLVRQEGVRTLWSGLSPTLVMAVPSTTLYFTAYDELREYLQDRGRGSWVETYAPLFAGMFARTGAVTVTAPLELMRTKMQSRRLGYGMWEGMRREWRSPTGWRSLWRGLPPTLLRDVPFSAVYWLGYERLKSYFSVHWYPESPSVMVDMPFRQSFTISFFSGATSGALAATLTTPFDVVKTRRQIQLYSQHGGAPDVRGTLQITRRIAAEEGVGALFTGLTARLGKVAPACAVMISSYEVAKAFFRSHPLPGE